MLAVTYPTVGQFFKLCLHSQDGSAIKGGISFTLDDPESMVSYTCVLPDPVSIAHMMFSLRLASSISSW